MHIRVSKWLFWVATGLVTLGLAGTIVYISEKAPPAPPPSPSLGDELSRAAKGRTDKGFPGHWYTENYERFLRVWKNEPIRIFEIGIADGGSLLMWQDYFPRASIYGVDINEASRFDNARVKTCVADQSKRDQLKKCLERFGGQFDLIIDDGGHSMAQQQVSLGFIFPYVRPGGFYVIEDLHSSLPHAYEGFDVEANENNSTLTMIFDYIHSAPMKFKSKYMLPQEIVSLDSLVETTDLHVANNQGHSMMCIFKRRGPQPLLDEPPTPPSPSLNPQEPPTVTTTITITGAKSN